MFFRHCRRRRFSSSSSSFIQSRSESITHIIQVMQYWYDVHYLRSATVTAAASTATLVVCSSFRFRFRNSFYFLSFKLR